MSSPPPPPPPSPSYSTTTILAVNAALFLILFFSIVPIASSGHTCSFRSETSGSSCPPFTSSISFPFSSSPGCGHPLFHIKCAAPHSLITINDLSFSLLRYEPSSSSLLLSPQPSVSSANTSTSTTTAAAAHRNCSSTHFLSIPRHPISLSGTPFRVSEASCSRLSVLRPCPPPNLPNCSHCPWECKLIKNPVQLLHGCGSAHSSASEQGCQGDVLGYLDDFLKFGIQIEWDEDQDSYFMSCRTCQAKNGVCGFNSSDPNKPFICFQSETRISPPWIHQHNADRISVVCSILVFISLLVITIGVIIVRSRRLKSSATEEDPTTLFLHRHRSANLILPPVFTYEELESSTNKFDTKRKIGDGGFGSVFLGQLHDGRIVAVKHLHRHQTSASVAAGRAFFTKSFCNEILILSSIDHPSLVKLHGYCSDPRGLLLVYDYVPNGTLAEHLHGPKSLYRKGSLTWQVRLEIALQTAMAMEYLHFSVEPAIVHRDITSSNIFVEKDMRIKVGDFGLSRLLVFPETTSSSSSGSGYVWTGPQGTPGYLDPDYHRSFRLTEKSDVYSFGVVLLELVTGMRAVDQSREKREMALADLVVSRIHMGLLHQVVDPVLMVDGEVADGVSAVAELAFRCVAADKDDRPDSKEVVDELRRVRSRTRVVTRVSNSNVVVSDDHES